MFKKIIAVILCCVSLTGCTQTESTAQYTKPKSNTKIHMDDKFTLSDYYDCPIILQTSDGKINYERYLKDDDEYLYLSDEDTNIELYYIGANTYAKINNEYYYTDSLIQPHAAVENININLEPLTIITKTNDIITIGNKQKQYHVNLNDGKIENIDDKIFIKECDVRIFPASDFGSAAYMTPSQLICFINEKI